MEGNDVTVVSHSPDFHFVLRTLWVAVGWRKRSDISFALEEPLKRKGIKFVPSR